MLLVDDTSPILSYSGEWSSVTSGGDTDHYWGNSFHATNSNASYATLSFIGTGVTVYGSKGLDHSTFTVTLDEEQHPLDGNEQANTYQAVLFSQTGLPVGRHHLTITNVIRDSSRPWLYLDYIDFETGQPDSIRNVNYTIDDANSTISYTPKGAWVAESNSTSQLIGGTVHTSHAPGAQVSTHFEGNAVYVFGSLGPGYGLVNVTVDGSSGTVVNCSASTHRSQALLFYTSVVSGRHSISIQIPSNASGKADFDSLIISRWSDNNGLGRSKAKTPIIAGSICGALILLAWATYLGHWTWTQRKKKKNMRPGEKKLSDAMKIRVEKKKEESEATVGRDAGEDLNTTKVHHG